MISYVMLGTNDLQRAINTYNPVMDVLGLHPTVIKDIEVLYAPKGAVVGNLEFVLGIIKPFNGQPATAGNGTMVTLQATSKEQVDQVYATAIEQGFTCEGKPGTRPNYNPRMYVAYFRDLDQNKLAVVHFDSSASK